MIYVADNKIVMALIRADKTFEETKVMNAVGANEIRSAAPSELEAIFGASKGFVGPKDIEQVKIPEDYEGDKITVVADLTAKEMKNFVIGANETDKHFVGVNLSDFAQPILQISDSLKRAKNAPIAESLCMLQKVLRSVTFFSSEQNILKQ